MTSSIYLQDEKRIIALLSHGAVFARLFDPRMSDPGRPNGTKSNLYLKVKAVRHRP
jgi:hypothetical protein